MVLATEKLEGWLKIGICCRTHLHFPKWLKCLLLFCCGFFDLPLFATEFFVAPNGSFSGDGSRENPWSLQAALSHPTNVTAGDIIWLRGGVYRRNNQPTLFTSRLAGAPFQPITLRRIPGERAIIDGNIFQSQGGSVVYWGLEIMNSHSNRLTSESGSFPEAFKLVRNGQTNDLCVSGFDLRAADIQLISVVVHDSIGGGIGINAQATNPLVYGALSFYNGWQGCDRAHGHGLYVQSVDPSYLYVVESLFFANYALGVQATSTEGKVDNFFMQGSGLFFNGVLARRHQSNFLLGPFAGQARNAVLVQNYVYDTQGTEADVNMGYQGGILNPQLYENYFQTKVRFSESNENALVSGNIFLGGIDFLNPEEHPGNSFSTEQPATNVVVIRPNYYEPGRAHVLVYNWENQKQVSVDVGWFLGMDTEFEVRNAQDFFGAPILSGTYTGQTLTLPMTNLRVAKPVGTNSPPSTAPEFNAFVIIPRELPVPDAAVNTAPVISLITNQLTRENSRTAPIPFTISDAETPADFLTISIHSSRIDLIPNQNIHFHLTGTNRTVTIVPAPDKAGASTITLAVSDGFLSVSNVFVVEVLPLGAPEQIGHIADEQPILFIENATSPLLRLQGPIEMEYEIETSTNLVDWNLLGTIFINCSGSGHLHDTTFSDHVSKFYRVSTNHFPHY